MCVLALLQVWYYGMELIPLSSPFYCCLLVVWREVKKWLPLVRLGAKEGLAGIRFLQVTSSPLSIEELMSYYRIPNNVYFELSDGPTESTIVEEVSVVYFTWEQLAAGLRFPISSMLKQFLHLSRAPPALIHLNVIRILIQCNVLSLLYQLEISLVEVYFIYTLKLGHGGRLSMSAQIPRVQFVTRLPNLPKTEAKGMILVRGPWYETPSSPDLPFVLNQSMSFPGMFKLWGFVCWCIFTRLSFTFAYFFLIIF